MKKLIRLLQKYSNFLLFLLLETIAILLIVQNTHYQRSKFVNLNRQFTGFINATFSGSREYLYLRQENEKLVRENADLRNRLERLSNKLDTSVVIREASDSAVYYYVPARIVNSSVYKQYNYLTIDKGKKEGVFRDMGVISELGLVGIVLESSNNFATILPVINRNFRLSAKIKSNNYAGILHWNGHSPELATLNEIPYHVEVNRGDTIITSGFSAIFPEGIHVGIIEDFSLEEGNFYDIKVRLFTDFQRLFHVDVIRNYHRKEQVTLEEKTPN